MIAFDEVAVGDELPTIAIPLHRDDLVRYAGASADFNPIHWNQSFALGVGLPDVIAHGMLTMAEAIRVVTDWTGDPGALVDYGVRFTRPVVVPDPDGTVIEVRAKINTKGADGLVGIDLTASVGGQTVLARAKATVRLPTTPTT